MNSSPRHKITPTCISLFLFLTFLLCGATRANAGSLDPAFDGDGRKTVNIVDGEVPVRTFIQPDGKILVVGKTIATGFHTYLPSPLLARFNSDGSMDTGFGTNGAVGGGVGNFEVTNAILQSDGKIVLIGGLQTAWNQPPADFVVMRYNSDGSRDTTFGTNGSVTTAIGGGNDCARAAALLPDGKLLVIGNTNGTQTSPGTIDLVRYNSNGTLDSTFGDSGIIFYFIGSIGQTTNLYDMYLLSSGKLIVNGDGLFARFNQDGSFDSSFGTNGILTQANTWGRMTLQPDGKMLVALPVTSAHVFATARFNTDGSVDNNFGTDGAVTTTFRARIGNADAEAHQAVVKSNGEIVVIGRTTDSTYSPPGERFAIARYTGNGSFIAKTLFTFPGFNVADGQCAAIQPDGKIVLAGTVYNPSTSDLAVARLTDVTSDAVFKKSYDFNGDFKDDIIVYRPGTGGGPSAWYRFNDMVTTVFGAEGDIITPADYNDDGYTDIAVFRPSNGTWYITSNVFANTYTAVQWGASGDIPVAADYDLDGKADVAVFRPSNGTWYILNSQDNSFRFVQWGTSGDKPVVGDYDGDSKPDVAVFRPSNGTWYVLKSSDGQVLAQQFGASGDTPAPGDYNGDGVTDMVIFRPATGVWYTSTDPATNYGAVQYGLGGDIAAPGDYDGDGKTDLAVFRPSNRSWYIRQSTNGSTLAQQWGASTDIPVPGN